METVKKISGCQWVEGKEQDEQEDCTGLAGVGGSENNPMKGTPV